MRKNTTKNLLGNAIRARLNELGMTRESFANRAQVPHDGLHAQLKRNRFTAQTLKALHELLGFPSSIDALRRRYDFRIVKQRITSVVRPGLESTEKYLDREARRFARNGSRFVRDLYSCLGSGYLVVVCTMDDPPVECTPYGWLDLAKPYVEAIRQGVTFIYIRPSDQYLSSLAQLLPDTVLRSDPQVECEELRKKVLVVEPSTGRTAVARQIQLHRPRLCPFWAPGVKYEFYGCNEGCRRNEILFLQFAVRNSSKTGKDSVIVSAEERLLRAFCSFIVTEFEKDEKLRPLLSRLS